MAIFFRPSAARHGIARERALYAIGHCLVPSYLAEDDRDEPSLVLFLATDGNAFPIEVVGIELPPGDLLVIHAMAMRRKYLDAFRRLAH